MNKRFGDVAVSDAGGFVALVEIQRPPNNFFDVTLIQNIADAFEALDDDADCRAIVLAADGKHFCAGANFGAPEDDATRANREEGTANPLYAEAVRLFRCKKPVVAAVQGAAVGGGFGLAMMADFRVGCPGTRMTANFVKLGFSPGFGLTHTLPRLVGPQVAGEIFLTGKRVNGEQARELGLLDRLVEADELRTAAIGFAGEMAENAPLSLITIRARLREGLADEVQKATDQEGADQWRLQQTQDHREGVKSVAERRPGNFIGE
ncbi:MAG: enoyl-CoA hydratase/isomerase family protein [Pseudomonadaceae bacterium]|nr:enoyl-CoA hydratase/isomerase family protein [Pseudomonadaceae bacterium]